MTPTEFQQWWDDVCTTSRARRGGGQPLRGNQPLQVRRRYFTPFFMHLDGYRSPPKYDPQGPTSAAPGSEEKIKVIERRVWENKVEVDHPDDVRERLGRNRTIADKVGRLPTRGVCS